MTKLLVDESVQYKKCSLLPKNVGYKYFFIFRKLCKRNISFKFSRVSYNKHLKDVRKQSLNLYKALRRKR